METKKINLPAIDLRPYQIKVWSRLFKENIKKAFLVWHRRAGKDIFCLQVMFARALMEVGNYWYILPQQNQVRRSIWEGITSDGRRYIDLFPEELVFAKNNSEMKLTLRHPNDPSKAGSIITFLGGDNYDALVGAGIKGCVISELALQKPNLYDLVIEPMLKETKGWVLFNSTPRGEGYAKDMFDFLNSNDKYLTSLLTIEDTGVVNPEDLQEERQRGKPEEIIQQEYYCSWQGAIYGAYYADVLSRAKYGKYPYDPRHPVYTAWDLGLDDAMAIWFVQFIDGSIRVIDYYENTGFGLGHYANVVLNKPWGDSYRAHYLPHDANHRQHTSQEQTQTIEGMLLGLGLNRIERVPRTNDVIADIQATRGIIPMCEFNEDAKDGYTALKHYHKDYDEKRRKFKDTPEHDWSSHGADAFRIIPFIERDVNRNNKVGLRQTKKWGGVKL